MLYICVYLFACVYVCVYAVFDLVSIVMPISVNMQKCMFSNQGQNMDYIVLEMCM